MKTLAAPCRFEERIRRSRFLAHAAPVVAEADTLAFYESVADPSATHNCWAWRVDGRYRFNDDGEPSGTAGRPLLSLLEDRDLDRVMLVVTRWYGGIKLGVGGLARAYSGTAAKALDQATLLDIVSLRRCEVIAGFEHSDVLHRVLERHGLTPENTAFRDQGVRLEIEVPQGSIRTLTHDLENASRGDIRLWVMRG